MNHISTTGRYYLVVGTAACVFFSVAALGKWPDPGSSSGSGGAAYGRSSGSSSFGRTTGGFWGGGK
jgi:hypothetical protein